MIVIVLIIVLVCLVFYAHASTKTCDLVVARYQESLDWLEEQFPSFRRIYVYNKGPPEGMNIPKHLLSRVRILQLENVGRCDHTYLHHILTTYDDLADVTVFLPGSCDLKHKHKTCLSSIRHGRTSLKYDLRRPDQFSKVSKFSLTTYNARHPSNGKVANVHGANKLKLCPQRPFGKWFRHVFGNTPIRTVTYYGIFAVSREDIQRRPRDLYALLIRYVDDHPNPEAGHYLERVWGMLFMEPQLRFRDNADILIRHDAGVFRDELGHVIDHKTEEREEQLTVLEYVRSDAKVLELGARYGTVTCLIDKILQIGNGIVVASEPDATVHEALYRNLSVNGCQRTKVFHGVVGDFPVVMDLAGYGTQARKMTLASESRKVENATFLEVQESFSVEFDTLMADCEGCVEDFIRHCLEHNVLKQFETVIYEMDRPDACDYPWIETVLKDAGMVKVRDSFLTVWQKKL